MELWLARTALDCTGQHTFKTLPDHRHWGEPRHFAPLSEEMRRTVLPLQVYFLIQHKRDNSLRFGKHTMLKTVTAFRTHPDCCQLLPDLRVPVLFSGWYSRLKNLGCAHCYLKLHYYCYYCGKQMSSQMKPKNYGGCAGGEACRHGSSHR